MSGEHRCGICRPCEGATEQACLCGRRRTRQRQQSPDGAVPQARRSPDAERELSRHGAGHIPTMFVPISEALPQARAGNIRMLAVSSGTRAQQAPDVPTIAESGFAGFHAVSWTGMVAPARTPKPIIDRIAGELARAMKDASFLEQLRNNGVDPADPSPAEFSAFIAKEITLWGEAVKVAGVTLQ